MIYLLDKSALATRHGDKARSRLERLILAGQLGVCEISALEILYSARGPKDYSRLEADLRAYRWLGTTQLCLERALSVQAMLATRGQHRVPIPDLIIAATAEQHGVTVLHHDRDFEIIAGVTDQPVERI